MHEFGEKVSYMPNADVRNEFGYRIAAVILKEENGKVLIGMLHKITASKEWEAVRRWVEVRKIVLRRTNCEVDTIPWN